jgi:hypothetical protein
MNLLLELAWTNFYYKLMLYGREFIDNSAVDLMCNNISDNHGILYRAMGQEIPSWINDDLKIKPEILQIFAAMPDKCGRIHMDGLDRRCALNIPVKGCSMGQMQWFDNNYTVVTIDNKYTKVRITNEEGPISRLDDTPVFGCLLTAPSVVNTDVWHRVDNRQNTDYRYVLSLRFTGNPSMDELLKNLH